MTRTIIHADMDAFYASVEQRDKPELQGKPVVVGGAAPRGVVAAASYEARRFGIHSAMPMSRAQARCPDLVVLPPDLPTYAAVSAQVFGIFRSYSPLVEGLSLDEAFIELTGTEKLFGSPMDVARGIKGRVWKDLELVVSIGVAPNKFLAKIASDLEKPDGLVVVERDAVRSFLHPLPISRLFGVGKVTEAQLHGLGINTIGELAGLSEDILIARLGASLGPHLYRLAQGIDHRDVESDRAPKSIGHEDTFSRDIGDKDELERIVREQADEVGRRLRQQGYRAKTVVLKLKTSRFELHTRRRKLSRSSDDGAVIGRAALPLLSALLRKAGPNARFRLTGVTAADLALHSAPRQLSFDEPAHQQSETLARTLDKISERFGKGAIQRGPGPNHGLRHQQRGDKIRQQGEES